MTSYPKFGSGSASNIGLMTCDTLSKEFVLDRPVVTLDFTKNFYTTDTLIGSVPGSGHPVYTAIGSTGIYGMLCNADNEGFTYMWKLPDDMDVKESIEFRILWSNTEAASANTNLWITTYVPHTAGTTALTAGIGGTALDTAHVAQVGAGAAVPQWTTWGVIAANKTGVKTLTAGNDYLSVGHKIDLTSMADATPLLVEIRYGRKYIG